MRQIIEKLSKDLLSVMYVYIDQECYEEGYTTIYINTEACHYAGILSDDNSKEEGLIADAVDAERASDATYDLAMSYDETFELFSEIAKHVPNLILADAPF